MLIFFYDCKSSQRISEAFFSSDMQNVQMFSAAIVDDDNFDDD